MKASLIEDEEMRLALLRGYNILDTAPDEGFDFDFIGRRQATMVQIQDRPLYRG